MKLGPTTATWHAVTASGDRDRYNTPTLTVAAGVNITGCRLEIEGAEERDQDERDTNLIRGLLIAPWTLGQEITFNDHFVIDGTQWEVHADPHLTYSHVGPHHWEIPIRRWIV